MSIFDSDPIQDLLAGGAAGKQERAIASLRGLLKQAVAGERRALKRAEEAESALGRMKKRAQNNIDRAFNKGVAAVGGDKSVQRIVRHPEFGTD